MDEKDRACSEAAAKIIAHSKRLLSRSLPLLMPAIYLLRDEETRQEGELYTDGVTLYYHAPTVLSNFQKRKSMAENQILHLVLHGLLGHFPKREGQIPAVFDTIADVKVRQMTQQLSTIAGKRYAPGDSALPTDAFRYCALNTAVPLEKLYLSATGSGELVQHIAAMHPHFAMDDHNRWNPAPEEGGQGVKIACVSGGEALWQQLASQLLLSMSASPEWGSVAGALQGDGETSSENDVSYTEFLLRFSVPREVQKIDADSFDRNWYQLGLDLYGDIPLLEPVEVTEGSRADQIVIAIDTSGSCGGDVMRSFLRETMNLLRDISDGAGGFEVRIIQCDAEIQGETTLNTGGDIARFLEDFSPKGFGGTDFRPVFQRIAQLREQGEMETVRGLLYLSDGFGEFPAEPPDYETAFIFPKEEQEYAPERNAFLPPWVTRIQLTEEDFTLEEDF